MLHAQALRKSFGPVVAVQNVSFNLAAGRLTAMLGENGAGKTTTLRMILGLLEKDAGEVEIAASRVGYVPENPAFLPWLSGQAVLDLTAGAFDIDPDMMRRNIMALSRSIDFDLGLLRRRPAAYSSGNRRKFAYIQNLAIAPDLLVADESFSALDPPAIRGLRRVLAGLRDDGAAILLSSHILAELDRLADDFIIIRRGQVAARAGLAEFRARRAFGSVGPDLEAIFMEFARDGTD